MFHYESVNPYPEQTCQVPSFIPQIGSEFVGSYVLAQGRKLPLNHREALEAFFLRFKKFGITHERGIISTHDGAQLETLEIRPSTASEHYIIKFLPRCGLFQDTFNLQEYVSDVCNLNVNVVAFNYRGVGESIKAPTCLQDLVVDGIAQVQRLLSQKVRPEHIILDGCSIGGVVATLVAAYFHNQPRPKTVYLWNDRSLASFSDFISSIKINIVLSWLFLAAIHSAQWDADIAKAYLSIPAQYRRYTFIAKASNICMGDDVIPHSASLHEAVSKVEQESLSTGYELLPPFQTKGHNLSRQKLICFNKNKNVQQLFYAECRGFFGLKAPGPRANREKPTGRVASKVSTLLLFKSPPIKLVSRLENKVRSVDNPSSETLLVATSGQNSVF